MDSLGAESQIISTLMCVDISMELCVACTRRNGISFGQCDVAHFGFYHVSQVRNEQIFFIKIKNVLIQLR
jgi:hypothetical protein